MFMSCILVCRRYVYLMAMRNLDQLVAKMLERGFVSGTV